MNYAVAVFIADEVLFWKYPWQHGNVLIMDDKKLDIWQEHNSAALGILT